MHAACGVIAALFQRERTGKGQKVEVAMQDAVLNFVRVPMMGTYLTGKPTPVGNRLGAGPLGDIFKCSPCGPNDYVYLYCSNQEMWETLFATIGKPEVAVDPRFTDRKQRRANLETLTQIVEEWTSRRTKHEVMKIMGEAGVPCGAVLDSVELLNDPHLREREINRDDKPSGARKIHDARVSGEARGLAGRGEELPAARPAQPRGLWRAARARRRLSG